MSTKSSTVTAEQLLAMPDDGRRRELVGGELRMMSPAGGRHGQVALNLALLLGSHVRQQNLGVVYAAETGFLISRDPDTVRAPDVAYVSQSRWQQIADQAGFVPFAPDVACEVISPHDRFTDVEEKALGWLAAGSQLVLLADPGTRTVHLYRSSDNIVVLDETAECDASDAVPEWKFPVADVFR